MSETTPPKPESTGPMPLAAASWEPLVGEDFVVVGLGVSDRLRLRSVSPLHGGGPRPDPFVLKFTNGAPTSLPQGIYRFVHPAIGEVEIFIVPLGPSPDGFLYEAIFN